MHLQHADRSDMDDNLYTSGRSELGYDDGFDICDDEDDENEESDEDDDFEEDLDDDYDTLMADDEDD